MHEIEPLINGGCFVVKYVLFSSIRWCSWSLSSWSYTLLVVYLGPDIQTLVPALPANCIPYNNHEFHYKRNAHVVKEEREEICLLVNIFGHSLTTPLNLLPKIRVLTISFYFFFTLSKSRYCFPADFTIWGFYRKHSSWGHRKKSPKNGFSSCQYVCLLSDSGGVCGQRNSKKKKLQKNSKFVLLCHYWPLQSAFGWNPAGNKLKD